SEELMPSSAFHVPAGHQNPDAMPYTSTAVVAQHVTLGAFTMPRSLVDQLNDAAPVKVDVSALPHLIERLGSRTSLVKGEVFVGDNAALPEVGDVRLRFSVIRPQTVSVVAQQRQDGLAPYQSHAGDQLDILIPGAASAEIMFKNAEAANEQLSWGLRAAGAVLMLVGFLFVLHPLGVLASAVPLLGGLVGFGLGLAAAALTIAGTLISIAAAWLWYRPLPAAVLAVAGLALGAGLLYLAPQRRRGASAAG
ncbi:MAG: TMEM43 family protein, partial [Alphaproteobacteria bacterium]